MTPEQIVELMPPGPPQSALERVARYVTLRGSAQGLDPNDINGISDPVAEGGLAWLTIEDLRTLLAAAASVYLLRNDTRALTNAAIRASEWLDGPLVAHEEAKAELLAAALRVREGLAL